MLRWLRDLDLVVASIAMAVVVGAVIWGMFTRYVTASPATWTSELATLAFAWVIFPGAAAGFRLGSHISIDVLIARLPPRMACQAELIVGLLVAVFCGALTWLSLDFAIQSWAHPTPVLGLPMSLAYLAATMGFGIMCMDAARPLVAAIHRALVTQAS